VSKCPVSPITNPNPVYSHCIMWLYVKSWSVERCDFRWKLSAFPLGIFDGSFTRSNNILKYEWDTELSSYNKLTAFYCAKEMGTIDAGYWTPLRIYFSVFAPFNLLLQHLNFIPELPLSNLGRVFSYHSLNVLRIIQANIRIWYWNRPRMVHVSSFPMYVYSPHNIVTCIPIVRQRLGKHIPEEANAQQ
jgi:hypothetical protein